MKKITYFFDCYFNQAYDFDDLNSLIQEYKDIESFESRVAFITELHQVIQTKSYKLASKIIEKYGSRTYNLDKTEQVLRYIYNKLLDKPAYINRSNFVKDCKVVFCPVCCPDPDDISSTIDKATVTEKNLQIYICKPCKLVWLTEDIRADNAQDYKKFMKGLGLKGTWKELSNVDTL